MIQVYNAVTPVIAGGAAATSVAFSGKIVGVGVRYSGTPSGAWSATIKHNMQGVAAAVDEPLLTIAAATNRTYVPMKLGQVVAGTDLAGSYTHYTANGTLAFAVTGGPNGQTVSFQVFVEG